MSVVTVTRENFEKEIMESEKRVLIDFWASWCGPCKMLSPIVDQIAAETDEVKVCKINIDEQGELASQFGVMSIPTLIVMEKGEVKSTSVGFKPKAAVLDLIK